MDQSLLPNIADFLAHTDPFDKFPEPLQRELTSHIQISYLMQGQSLPPEKVVGAGLYIVRMGAIEQRELDHTLRARLSSGDLFGFSQINAQTLEYTVTALENTLLYHLPTTIIQSVLAKDPQLMDLFAGQECQRLSVTLEKSAGHDTFYMSPIDGVVNTKMAIVPLTATIHEAAQEMVSQHRSSVLIMDGETLCGILTDRDMTKRVITAGIDINNPVSDVMTPNPITIESHEPVIRAVETMMENNVRSLPVIEQHKIKGVLTATSLVNNNSVQAVYLISRIYRQDNLSQLKQLHVQRQSIFEALVNAQVHPRSIQQIMTLIADAFNKRLLQLAHLQFGPAPMTYCWLVAGSQARNEMHYISDQDNGLLLERKPTQEEQAYFRQLTEWVCYGLDECGYTLCPGHMMATNPKWCLSFDKWCENYAQWIMNPEQEALLNVSVFMDLRGLYGNQRLFTQLQQARASYLLNNVRFLTVMLANSLRIHPPLGLFRQFVLAKDGENHSALNIKKQAINLIVELARVYALAANSMATSTEERLQAAVNANVISEASQKELLEAFYFINQVRFTHQRDELIAGKVLSNYIDPKQLTQFERNHLKDAFRIIARTQEFAQQRFNAKGVIR